MYVRLYFVSYKIGLILNIFPETHSLMHILRIWRQSWNFSIFTTKFYFGEPKYHGKLEVVRGNIKYVL